MSCLEPGRNTDKHRTADCFVVFSIRLDLSSSVSTLRARKVSPGDSSFFLVPRNMCSTTSVAIALGRHWVSENINLTLKYYFKANYSVWSSILIFCPHVTAAVHAAYGTSGCRIFLEKQGRVRRIKKSSRFSGILKSFITRAHSISHIKIQS